MKEAASSVYKSNNCTGDFFFDSHQVCSKSAVCILPTYHPQCVYILKD